MAQFKFPPPPEASSQSIGCPGLLKSQAGPRESWQRERNDKTKWESKVKSCKMDLTIGPEIKKPQKCCSSNEGWVEHDAGCEELGAR